MCVKDKQLAKMGVQIANLYYGLQLINFFLEYCMLKDSESQFGGTQEGNEQRTVKRG